MKKVLFYKGESVSRRNKIMDWFLEDANIRETRNNLQNYLDFGDIGLFENQLEEHLEPAFIYINTYNMTEDFALRLINKFNLVKSKVEERIITSTRRQQTGTIKGKRVHIKQYTSVKIGKKVIFRARDNKGRFVKVRT